MFDYKKIIKSRKSRVRLLHLFDFLPDSVMVKIQYRIKTGRKLSLSNPERFSEKLQWYKVNYRDELMQKCVNKIAVKEYVAETIGSEYLIPTVAVYSSEDEINLSALPVPYVVKDSLGSGNNEVIICKTSIDAASAVNLELVKSWLGHDSVRKHPGREWVYESDSKPQILVEEFIQCDDRLNGLLDYKFFCFGGKARYMYVIGDRIPGRSAKLAVYDAESFTKLDVYRCDEERLETDIPRPANFEKMKSLAEHLSKPFPHVRVDMYDLGPKQGVKFGELTFFDGSGYFSYDPDEFDYIMGREFVLPEKGRRK